MALETTSVDTIFCAAVEITAEDARTAYIARACGDDEELRNCVAKLVAAHFRAGSFLDPLDPPRDVTGTLASPIPEQSRSAGPGSGKVIGPYKLLQQIGEGGMGTVYMAEQTRPVQRKVALKLIKPGMDTGQVIARFEAERQALAMMDHVNIARVFDAGTTETGLPFFVMELVHGVPITKYCDDNQLTPRERLELFVPVCQAIQHAHQKGIIHRDIKPSNVMITLYDGKPVPKVIDFGVAKATEQKLTERTLFTQYGTMVGTLEYMSPEQAEMSALGVDTRSDIYSLGVLLYELLTGSTPLSRQRFKDAAYGEILRIIKEEEPPRPSTRLSDSGEALASISAQRKTEPAKLSKLMRGELDWIVMKTLEKDRNRRYETANGFAADVQRYLNDETVQACPPSTGYRFRKFARRNKRALAAISVVIVAMLLAVTVLAISTVIISREKGATESALLREKQATGELQNSLDREQKDGYFHRIALIHRELTADNLGRALELLRECPEALRDWEWHYLRRLCRVEPVVLRHATEVYSVAFHPDGRRIAAACGDKTIKIWDVKTGTVIQTLRGHDDYVFSVVFSPDRRHLASASADRTVRVWNLETEDVFQLSGNVGDYAGLACAVAFSPDGRHVVAGDENGIATVWSVADHRAVHRLPEHENTAVCVAFSPDGRLLATGSWKGVLRIWDARTGQLLHRITAHISRMSALVFRHDSLSLATAGFDRTAKVWDAATGELLETLTGHTGVISGLAFSRDDQRLFSSGGEDKMVKVWDPLTRREVVTLRGHTLFCHCLAASDDGLRLASAGKDKTIRIWDATPVQGDDGKIQSADSGLKHAATAQGQRGLDSLTLRHDSEVWSVAYSPDGRYLASACWGNRTVRIWDLRTGAAPRIITLPSDIMILFHLAFSPDNERLAVAAASSDREAVVNVWETATGREVFEPLREKRSVPFFVTFDPTGRFLVREGLKHTVQIHDAKTGEVVGIIGRHTLQIWGMAFSPDGKRLATASNDGTVRLWTWDPTRPFQEQRPQLQLDVHVDGYGNRVAFSPDSKCVATGAEGHTVKIWDANTGKPEEPLRGHTGDVFAVAFSRDGRWLATAGEDTTVRIWNLASGKLRHTLRGHTGQVMSLAFSPDSEHLASGSRDHTMKIWHTQQWKELPDR